MLSASDIPAQLAALQAENERLREGLEFYAKNLPKTHNFVFHKAGGQGVEAAGATPR